VSDSQRSNDSPLKIGQKPSGCSDAKFMSRLALVASNSRCGRTLQLLKSLRSRRGIFLSCANTSIESSDGSRGNAAVSVHDRTSQMGNRSGDLAIPATKRVAVA